MLEHIWTLRSCET